MSQSEQCQKRHCIPGNPGIAQVAQCHDIDVSDHEAVLSFVYKHDVNFVVIGPEQPLVDGLGSVMRDAGIAVFGPDKVAAQMEGSKGYMKDFCARHNIPTAAYGRFTDFETAKDFIKEKGAPIVLKTDGLAAGKGVIIAQSIEEAIDSAQEMLSGRAFGQAGAELVIEEFLEGEEVSYFFLADGKNYLPLTSAQDHKRVGDGDTGPNTGGMGAYSPAHLMTAELEEKIIQTIVEPTVKGMEKDGTPFQGVLFAGIMIVGGVPKLLEYNIRFGDPECQPIMTRLDGDLVALLKATNDGTLDQYNGQVTWSDKVALCVVMAAQGYPASYVKNTQINGIDDVQKMSDIELFHAGTKQGENNDIVSVGGRVLGVVGMGSDVKEAQRRAYAGVDVIDWPEGFCRRDIGYRAIAAGNEKAA